MKICEFIGKPHSKHDWPDFFKLDQFESIYKLSDNNRNLVFDNFKEWPEECGDLVYRLLCWDPH